MSTKTSSSLRAAPRGPELQNHPKQLAVAQNKTTAQQPHILPYVNYAEREANRHLTPEKVLGIMRQFMPEQYNLAEVVGSWVWVTFQQPPPETIRSQLSQLGFHWNNLRKCWQHPCGQTESFGSAADPRHTYGSHFIADTKAA